MPVSSELLGRGQTPPVMPWGCPHVPPVLLLAQFMCPGEPALPYVADEVQNRPSTLPLTQHTATSTDALRASFKRTISPIHGGLSQRHRDSPDSALTHRNRHNPP